MDIAVATFCASKHPVRVVPGNLLPFSSVFEDVRRALHELLHGDVPPEGRHEVLSTMRETLVRARLAIDDLRETLRVTERRVTKEQAELETVQRRRRLAEGIDDAETVLIAARFEGQHQERLAVLLRKKDAQASELALAEREVEEMTEQFKAASAGVGSGMGGANIDSSSEREAEARNLEREFNQMGRAERRAAAEADAEARLADLKRRMGK